MSAKGNTKCMFYQCVRKSCVTATNGQPKLTFVIKEDGTCPSPVLELGTSGIWPVALSLELLVVTYMSFWLESSLTPDIPPSQRSVSYCYRSSHFLPAQVVHRKSICQEVLCNSDERAAKVDIRHKRGWDMPSPVLELGTSGPIWPVALLTPTPLCE